MDSDSDRRAAIERVFVDANAVGEPREVMSPSGRFRLTIRGYRQKENGWAYSRGIVTRIADGAIVCDIKRNLSGFHHSFVEKDGREFLISGRSYMSQTIVDLDRAIEHEAPGEQYGGWNFCWASCTLSPDGNTLAVDGCIWACPYEIRFFDFTDPARGWPALEISGVERIDEPSDAEPSRWLDATTFVCNQHDTDKAAQERTTLVRRDNQMVVVDQWVSESERARREQEARDEAEHDAWLTSFKAGALWQRFETLVREHHLPDEWPGSTPERRIVKYFRRKEPKASADLHWDTIGETLKVVLYDAAGAKEQELSFPQTLAGVEGAVAAIAERFVTRASTGRAR